MGLREIAPAIHPSTSVYIIVLVAVLVGVGALIDRWWALIGPLALGALLIAVAVTVVDSHIATYPGSDTTAAQQVIFMGVAFVGETICLAVGVLVRRFARRFARAS